MEHDPSILHAALWPTWALDFGISALRSCHPTNILLSHTANRFFFCICKYLDFTAICRCWANNSFVQPNFTLKNFVRAVQCSSTLHQSRLYFSFILPLSVKHVLRYVTDDIFSNVYYSPRYKQVFKCCPSPCSLSPHNLNFFHSFSHSPLVPSSHCSSWRDLVIRMTSCANARYWWHLWNSNLSLFVLLLLVIFSSAILIKVVIIGLPI